jgi:phosphate/sulfate permease
VWWFLYGLIVGAGVMRLVTWAQQGQIAVAWYVWPLMALVLLLGALTGQHFFASYKELEPRAAWMGVLFIGVPCLILAGVVTLLLLT